MTEMGPVHDDGAYGFQAWVRHAMLSHRAHTHHDFELNHVAHGWCEYILGGRRVRLTADRSYLFWATLPHQMIAIEPGTQMGWVVLPVDWLWRWRLPEPFAASLLQGDLLADSRPEPDDARAIRRWGEMLARRDLQWTRIAELEVEARLRRMMLVGPDTLIGETIDSSTRTDPGRHSLQRVHAMAAFITARSHEPIAISDVADHVSLDPSYAMRLFRKHMKMTCVDYLTQQRIAAVKRRLMTSDDPLLNIAFDCGFGSASQFHEAFRQVTGTTPARFRKSLAPK